MHKINGKINVFGKLAFVPQVAWIQNSTIKENILFNEDFDKEYYYQCIESCALAEDLSLFEFNDETEIGEKVKSHFKFFFFFFLN